MTECLFAMLLTGSGVYLLWRLLLPVTEKRFSARWQYGLLKLALAFFLLPVGPLLAPLGISPSAPPPSVSPPALSEGSLSPAAPAAPAGAHLTEAAEILTPRSGNSPAVEGSSAAVPLLTALWLLGAAVLGGWELRRRARFRRQFLRLCAPVEREEILRTAEACRRQTVLRRPPALLTSPLPCSPFVTGLARPVVVLPQGEIGAEELRYILLHEMLHIRRRDLWVRALARWVRTVYWFHPLVWQLDRQVLEWSEMACDERLTAPMDRGERRVYGQVILKAAMQNTAAAGVWSAGLAAPETMKRRLHRMLQGNQMKKSARAAAALTLALLVSGGCLAAAATCPPVPERVLPAQGSRADAAPSAPAEGGPAGSVKPPAVTEAEGGVQSAGPETPAVPVTLLDPPPAPAQEPRQDAMRSPEEQAAAPEPDPLTAPADGTRYPVAGSAEREALIARLCRDYGFTNSDFIIHINRENGGEVVELYRESTWLNELAEQHLVDGDWPRNSRGESYGPECLKAVTGTPPDLAAAVGTDGTDGYIRLSDKWENRFGIHSREDAAAYMAFMESIHFTYTIPLYSAEGEVIGQFLIGGGTPTPSGEELRSMLEEDRTLNLSDEDIERYIQQLT